MLFQFLKMRLPVGDEEFNKMLPNWLYTFSRRHWTPINVAKEAAKFLADKPGKKILDIGSGVGKFCMLGATYTEGVFTGVEYRENLHEIACGLVKSQGLINVHFINSDIANIDFREYDSFYFFNPFQEHIDITAQIDDSVEMGNEQYDKYTVYVREQLAKMPSGTRLATYWSQLKEVPAGYRMVAAYFDKELKLWEKQ